MARSYLGRFFAWNWAFAKTRRWLLASIAVTVIGLVLVRIHPPPTQIGIDRVDEAEFKFDDVTLYPVTSVALRFRPPLRGDAPAAAGSPTVSVADESALDNLQVTRRLDAVRSWQSRGATLIGRIEPAPVAAPAPLRTAGREAPGAVSRQ
jgi:hypothetical protein